MEIWQLRRAQLIPWDCTRPVSTVPLPPLTAFSEAELDAYAQLVRRLEIAPPMIPRFNVGSWAIDRDGELYHLEEYTLDDPRLLFPEGDPYGRFVPWGSKRRPEVVEKYISWLRAGFEPPPLSAMETEKKNIKVYEGHHRAESLVKAGRRTSLIWISPVFIRPDGVGTGLTHERAIKQALDERKPIPREVLADYPHLYQHEFSTHLITSERGYLYSWQ